MPYRDFDYTDTNGNTYSRYQPNPSRFNPAWSKTGTCLRTPEPWNWEPLLETNGFGFFSEQLHVTPFIGFTGKLLGVTEEEYESFSSPLPEYGWCAEADYALEKTRVMASSDLEKMEIEFHDNKFFSLLPLQINWQIAKGFSLFDFWFYDMVLDVALHDATMLVWRDKVIFDLVRPTTVVHAVKGDQDVTTYGGPGQGEQTIKGNDWQPRIRTMPHAEYPSGSSCLCKTFEEVMVGLTGKDSTQGTPLTQTFPAGSSLIDPGSVPSEDLTVEYDFWSETTEACGRSRENGGMHFSQAVPAGEELCSGLAALIIDRANLLLTGDPTGALADFNDRTIRVKSKSY